MFYTHNISTDRLRLLCRNYLNAGILLVPRSSVTLVSSQIYQKCLLIYCQVVADVSESSSPDCPYIGLSISQGSSPPLGRWVLQCD